MKKQSFFMSVLAIGLLIVSCKNEPTPPGPGEKGKYDDYPYSSLTPEQQKAKLSAEADGILQKVKGLQDTKAAELLKSLGGKMDQVAVDPTPVDVSFFYSKQFRNNFWEEDVVNVADVQGTFTWNFQTEEFNYAETPDDKLVIILPESVNSNANNGKLEITGTGSGVKIEDDEESFEIPSSVKVLMFVNNAEVASIEMSAQGINKDKGASASNVSVKIDSYTLSFGGTQSTDNKISSTFSFAKGLENILKGSVGGAVNWDYIHEYEDWVYDEATGEYELSMVKDTTAMPESVKADLEIGSNLAIEGYVNIRELTEELDAIDKKYDFNSGEWTEAKERAKVEEETAAYNKHMNFVLVSRTERTKIARIKYGVTSKQNTYMVCDYGECHEELGSTYYYADLFLQFNDNTEASAESYFGEGFDSVIEAWEDFLLSFDIE